jgi:cytochrome b
VSRVWTVSQRLGHWALAACVLAALWLHEGGPWHMRLGYVALALVAWRGLRGFIGPQVERFAVFVRGPRATWRYANDAAAGIEQRHLNHNPLGAWMVVALLLAGLAAGISGALYDTDAFWGDPVVYAVHQLSGWSFAVLVPLHLLGVIVTSWRHRENLVASMIHGRKRR